MNQSLNHDRARPVAALAAGLLLSASVLSGCSTTGAGSSTTTDLTSSSRFTADDGFVISAAILGGPALTPVFTVQGRLDDKGGPFSGTIETYALIRETPQAGGEVIAETPITPLIALDGLFTLELPLPDPEDLANAGDLIVQLFDANDDTKVGGAIPLRFAPRAWSAEFARTAGSASSASAAATANFANSAAVASSLSNDRSVELVYSTGFENYGFTYDAARATRVGNMVFLSGLVEAIGSGTGIVATLPADMRPIGRHIFSASSNGQYVRVDILTDGRVQLLTPPQIGWFSLTGCSFPVAP